MKMKLKKINGAPTLEINLKQIDYKVVKSWKERQKHVIKKKKGMLKRR